MKTDLIDRLREEWSLERPELDTSAMALVGRLIVLGEVLRKRVDEVLAPLELGYTEFGVLATLNRSGRPYELTPSRLLETVLIQSGSLTACLDRLARRALVERLPNPDDRRSCLVRLTRTGRRLVAEAMTARLAQAAEFLAPLSKADRATLEPLLRTLMLAHRPIDDPRDEDES